MADDPVAQPTNKSPHTSRAPRLVWLAWILCGLITALALVNLVLDIARWSADSIWIDIANKLVFILLPIVYALMAALIASRQPRNTIAWLLMTIAIAIVLIAPVDRYLQSFSGIPEPAPLVLFCIWFQNWSWLLFIVPLLLVLLLFPTGQPPTPSLRWVPYFAVSLVACFALLAALSPALSPSYYPDWELPNPIGLIPETAEWLITPVLAGLALLVVVCPTSLFYRYRRATAIEREQIKWLLYTSAVFVALYLPWIGTLDSALPIISNCVELLMFFTLYFFPAAIAIAILRYRLWDIDVIIRRTLVYGGLTATLALVYFSSVVLLQQLLGALIGQADSPLAIVISTLGIAALFTPLRRRIQNDIDRRFFRRKYDAQKTLESFAARARDEVELEKLTAYLLAMVQETMQPESVGLWLKQ
jgi:hypothetical protein